MLTLLQPVLSSVKESSTLVIGPLSSWQVRAARNVCAERGMQERRQDRQSLVESSDTFLFETVPKKGSSFHRR